MKIIKKKLVVKWFVLFTPIGIANHLAPIYMLEVVPVNLRDASSIIYHLSIEAGILCSSIVGLNAILGELIRIVIYLKN